MKKQIFRILDVNYNRTKEALRVNEDLARFLLKDVSLTRELKKCRHKVSRCLLAFPVAYGVLVSARDSVGDVGKHHVIQDRKASPQDLLVANFKRGQESLRVLEEVSKLISDKHSRTFKNLRFDLYELEKKALRKF